MAAEGRSGKLELSGQGAEEHRGQQAPINLRLGGMRTDGTAFYHNCAPKSEFPLTSGYFQAIRNGAAGPAQVGQMKAKIEMGKGKIGKKQHRKNKMVLFFWNFMI